MDLVTTAQVLGNFGEFFGAIAVVTTLGYLAFQSRQNTRSSYVSRGDTARERLFAINQAVINDQELAGLVAHCRTSDVVGHAPADEERIERFAQQYLTAFAGVERAYQSGELPDQQYEVFLLEFERNVTTYPGLASKMRAILADLGPAVKHYPIYKALSV